MARSSLPLPGWVYLVVVVLAAYVPPWLLSWRASPPSTPSDISQIRDGGSTALVKPGEVAAADSSGTVASQGGSGESAVVALSGEIGNLRSDFSAALPSDVAAIAQEADIVQSQLRARLPDDPDAIGLAAQVCWASGREGDAESLLRQYLSRHPQAPACWYLLGEVLLERGELDDAERNLRLCMERSPDYAAAYDALRRLYLRRNDSQKAQECAEQFGRHKERRNEGLDLPLQRFGADFPITKSLLSRLETQAAKVYHAHGNLPRTEEYLLRSVAMEPTNGEARQLLAAIYEESGNDLGAAQLLEEWRRIAPNELTPYLRLAAYYGRRLDYLRTQQVLADAVAKFPNEPVPQAMLAKFYIDTGEKLQKAVTLAANVVAMEPSAVNYELLSEAYLAVGHREKAEEALRQARKLDPTNPRLPLLETRIRETGPATDEQTGERAKGNSDKPRD